ncbi:MAG TPA: SAM-dependent methyltransferase [Rhabdochlamydiaceae bacterium]|nr:SAM-dependent methyltransferase [Rhabdochlamydiaceae bacterium]
MKTGYLAPHDLEGPLRAELKEIVHEYGRLMIANGPPQKVYWAQNIWYDPQMITFTSISDATKKLRQLQKLWSFYPYTNIRRAELITQQLPYFSPKPLVFPAAPPKAPLGSWTLLDSQTLLASPHCSSPFAQGEVHFQESKIPPSRAYLKLWELFTRIGKMPKADDFCLEIGASPGSWTWVLQQLGAKVIAVDRAALDPSIARFPKITFMKKDAFSLGPDDLPKLDWIFSDVVCYPEKLLSWIKKWLGANPEINFVCTLKFQGSGGYDIIKEFEKIEDSELLHLYNNKHELTWFKL